MRIFRNCKEMIKELPREVFTRGVIAHDNTCQGKDVSGNKDFEQKEIIGVAYTINDFSDRDEMLKIASEMFGKTHIRKEVALKWVDDMLHNDSLLETWWFEDEYTKKYFYDFCNEGTIENPKCAYTYGNTIIPQLKPLLERLRKNKFAKGAYISIFGKEDVAKIGRRVGCTLSYGFRVINGLDDKLVMFLHMRSQDLCNFMALDIYKASCLLEYVAKELNIKPGKMICYIDSLHAYYRDIKDKDITW
jgi:thymidylate synthase